MQDDAETTTPIGNLSRWTLIRDIGVLQFKLVIDGLRDLVLVPVSLIAGLLSLLRTDSNGSEFYDLLRLGKKSERWINLFGAVEHAPAADVDDVDFSDNDIDAMVTRVESFVVEEYRKGGLTRQAKDRIDRAMDALHGLARGRNSKQGSDDQSAQ